MTTLFATVVLLSIFPITDAAPMPVRLSDAEIAHIAVTANRLDITAAEQALERSENQAVRQFAETMVRDHQAVIDQAAALAGRLGVEPVDNDTSRGLAKGAQATRQRLARLEGAAFDRAYMENEVSYHEAVIATVADTLVPATSNDELRELLEGVLPALRAHLEQARGVLAALPNG